MKKLFLAIYFGFALGGLVIIGAFMTGSTFGQRCAKIWPDGSEAWRDCVERFATGRPT